MHMRVLVAGLLGGLTIFFWGFISHMLLPLGEIGIDVTSGEDAVLQSLRATLPHEGIYLLPGLAREQYEDPKATAAYSAKALANPYAFIVYQPQGKDDLDMTGNLAREWLGNTLSALLAAVLLTLGKFSFMRRVSIAGGLGIFAWLAISLPYWNWYRFPLDFTLANLLQQVIGWLLAGAVMAMWLGRREG